MAHIPTLYNQNARLQFAILKEHTKTSQTTSLPKTIKKTMNPPCKHTCFITCIGKTNKEECQPDKPYHNINPNYLSLSVKEINRTRESNLRSLIKRKKLHLLLDLDNTLIHTIPLNRLTSADRDYLRYTQKEIDDGVVNPAYIHEILDYTYALKIRPGVKEFLMQLEQLFDISIYTLAGRTYAKVAAEILDPYKCTFKDIITKENSTSAGYKGLDVVLYPERVTVIVDDSREVWKRHAENLIQIKPYEFFDLSLGFGVEKLVTDEPGGCTDMDTELFRVLMDLKKLHHQFYKGKNPGHSHRDVRKMIRDIGVFYKMVKEVF